MSHSPLRRIGVLGLCFCALGGSPAIAQVDMALPPPDPSTWRPAPDRCVALDAVSDVIATRSAEDLRALYAEFRAADATDPLAYLERTDEIFGFPRGTALGLMPRGETPEETINDASVTLLLVTAFIREHRPALMADIFAPETPRANGPVLYDQVGPERFGEMLDEVVIAYADACG